MKNEYIVRDSVIKSAADFEFRCCILGFTDCPNARSVRWRIYHDNDLIADSGDRLDTTLRWNELCRSNGLTSDLIPLIG